MKLSRESNQGARAIVKLVEQQTGADLTLGVCMAVAAEIQTAINSAPEVGLLSELRRNTKLLKKYAKAGPGLEMLQSDLLKGTQALLTATDMERATERLRGNK